MANGLTSIGKSGLDVEMMMLTKSGLNVDENAKMENAAEQFEALFVQQMINSMWNSVPKNDTLFGGGNEEAFYRDMFNQTLSEEIAKSQSIGIKDMILKEMKK